MAHSVVKLTLQHARCSLKSCKASAELIASYKKKIEFLKNLTATEKLTKAGAKALTSSQLLGVGQMGPTQATTADKSVGKTSELQLAAKGRLDTNLRDELFGDKKVEDEIGPAQSKETKKETKSGMTSEDFDQVVQHHKQTQERIAEEMLSMARSLKESTSAAGKVVREDTRRIQASSRLADSNLEKLETQSKRLEAHVKKCCDWGLWIALLAVCVTFIMMIGFMKLSKKRTF